MYDKLTPRARSRFLEMAALGFRMYLSPMPVCEARRGATVLKEFGTSVDDAVNHCWASALRAGLLTEKVTIDDSV